VIATDWLPTTELARAPQAIGGREVRSTTPDSALVRLAFFRISLAGILLAQAFALIGHLEELFGGQRVADRTTLGASPLPGVPDLAWLERVLDVAGASRAIAIPFTLAAYVVGLLGLLFGCRTRWSAILAWLGHTALLAGGNLAIYGVDQFAQIGLFYCVFFPAGHALSRDRAANRVSANSAFQARLSLAVLQAHVCVFYTASGIEKALGAQWWSGEAVWRAVMGAPLDGPPFDCSFLASVPWLVQLVCWTTLVFEAGIVAFVWHPRLRMAWLVGVIGMHAAIAVLMNLWTFSAIMIAFDVAAFGGRPWWNCREVGGRLPGAAEETA
jgi:hypothetical protein